MSSFCVLRTTQNPQFEVDKLDINLWLLPSLFGRRTIFCDIGLKITPLRSVPDDHLPNLEFQFDLGLPFTTHDPIQDLGQFFFNSAGQSIANAIFGNSEPLHQGDGTISYDDGDGVIVFPSIEPENWTFKKTSEDNNYSIVRVNIPNKATRGQSNYIRIRFRVHKSQQLWRWHNVSGRRRYSVSDLRVNEFRETPRIDNPPNFKAQAFPIKAVHCLMIFSSKLRITQTSPQPRYIRILERPVWEKYLKRRTSRSGEMFVITYWRHGPHDADSSEVVPNRPFRAYLDVERRGDRLTRATVATLCIVAFVLVLLQLQQQYSLFNSVDPRDWQVPELIGAVGFFGFLAIFAFFYQMKPEIHRFENLFRKIERRWYKQETEEQ